MEENKFFICFNPNTNIEIKQKDFNNEKLIYKVIDAFRDEASIIKKQNFCLYFGYRRNKLGFLLIKNTPGYNSFPEKHYIPNYDHYDYIIYISLKIRESDNDIFKAFTISHELQHLLQEITLSNTLKLKSSILFKYYILKRKNPHKLPREIDSFRKSKIIITRIYGEEEINNFIAQQISTTKDNDIKKYWEYVKSINTKGPYFLEKEISSYWEKYKQEIKDEIERIRRKNSKEITDNEKEFLEIYNEGEKEIEFFS